MKNVNLKEYFNKDTTAELTKDVLGHELIYRSLKGIVSGIIVEAEAYLGAKDSAAHAFKGHRSAANEALYEDPGTIYIYTLRGHYMLDVATQKNGEPQGILIRGIEPLKGKKIMLNNRTKHGFDLTNGPAKLTEAMGIDSKELNMKPMDGSPLTISLTRIKEPSKISASARVNVSTRGDWTEKPLRYYVAGNPYVSKMRKRDMDETNYGWEKQ